MKKEAGNGQPANAEKVIVPKISSIVIMPVSGLCRLAAVTQTRALIKRVESTSSTRSYAFLRRKSGQGG